MYIQLSVNALVFLTIFGMQIDQSGNVVAASLNEIVLITPSGTLTIIPLTPSDGTDFIDITLDGQGNYYLPNDVSEGTTQEYIYKTNSLGVLSPFAGNIATNGGRGNADGSLTTATFNDPYGICIDTKGNLYVADAENGSIRKIVLYP